MDTNWQLFETPHFIFNVCPGSFAAQNVARLGEVLEDQYAFALTALDIRYAGRISLFLFESAADADDKSERSGTAYPETGAVRAIVSPPLETTYGLVAHVESRHPAHRPRPAGDFVHERRAGVRRDVRTLPSRRQVVPVSMDRQERRTDPGSVEPRR
jgi:hypothetical protein